MFATELSPGAWYHVTITVGRTQTTATMDGQALPPVDYDASPVNHFGSSLTLGCQRDLANTTMLRGACLTQFLSGASHTSLTDTLSSMAALESLYPGGRLRHHGLDFFSSCYPMERSFPQVVQFTTPESHLMVTTFTASSLFLT